MSARSVRCRAAPAATRAGLETPKTAPFTRPWRTGFFPNDLEFIELAKKPGVEADDATAPR
jgi:hypothetical protein